MSTKSVKKIAMISQPMGNLTKEEIGAARVDAVMALNKLGYSVVNTWMTVEADRLFACNKDGEDRTPLLLLGKSIEKLSMVDAVYFVKGWDKARGCRIERAICEEYDIEIIDED